MSIDTVSIDRQQAAKPADGYVAMRDGAILPTLVALTIPNLVALCSAAIVTIAETAYVGRLGLHALGGVALVFPVMMLMQMLSAGAMGGGISGAISRALGAGREDYAQALALSAALIGLTAGVGFALMVWLFGPAAYALLGGTGAVFQQATSYSSIAALGIAAIWVTNSLASVARGAGNMVVPAAIVLAAGLLQIAVGGTLGLGLGPAPRLGVAGVAAGQVAAFLLSAAALLIFLRSRHSRLALRFDVRPLDRAAFADILRVGLPATLSPLQSVATVLILTAFVARFGPEALAGYGIGSRLEFLLIPVAFSVGVACLPMVGTAIGFNAVGRARRVAWTAGALAAAALGIVGLIAVTAPDIWSQLFVNDASILEAADLYLRTAGIGYPFFGLGLCLYFASQGAGRIGGAIAAQTLRLAIVCIGGAVLVAIDAPLWMFFALSAAGMIMMGIATAAGVYFTTWGVRR